MLELDYQEETSRRHKILNSPGRYLEADNIDLTFDFILIKSSALNNRPPSVEVHPGTVSPALPGLHRPGQSSPPHGRAPAHLHPAGPQPGPQPPEPH